MEKVNYKGRVLRLEGKQPQAGEQAPDFVLTDGNFASVTLRDFAGKTLALVCLPSLDTPVCDLETRRFNEEAAKLSDQVRIVIISRDLPFAQARWCGAANVRNVRVLSDYLHRDFGKKYGVLMEKTGLLARAVFVIAPGGIITYEQVLPEVSREPDYDAAIAAIKAALR